MQNKLILLRHGESQWNLENRFTGWTDVNLTKKGEEEAKNAGILLNKKSISFDSVYVSYLKRAINTSKICLEELKTDKTSLISDWRLNERHYGNLQGLNKSETAKKYGDEQVFVWRRSYDAAPPKLSFNDKKHPKYDPLYFEIQKDKLPRSESLKDTLERVKPLWINNIKPKLKKGQNILIVAHGNSLRAIIKMLKKINNKDIVKLNVPTGAPYVFEFKDNLTIKSDYYLSNKIN
tara:strand:+ start:1832 stop:2536 length:705 start_codon:yes stop_codon:yes gene_type:complete